MKGLRPITLFPRSRGAWALALVAAGCSLAGCAQPPPAGEQPPPVATGEAADPGEVVIYTSVDQAFAEPVLAKFEAETGIDVKPIFDVEAAKTTGLVNRLLAETQRPQADVWWSGEFAQTVTLADQGVLAPYTSPAAADLPAPYHDPDGRWTAFGGRARVILVNTDRLRPQQYPGGLDDFLNPTVPAEEIGIALPMFGTTANQAAAQYASEGPEKAKAWYEALAQSGVRVVDGNSVVRDMVANGTLAYGLTDTDDACGAVEKGAPVAVVVPDQAPGERGTLVVPNTVGLVKEGPNPEAGKALVDYLLAATTEADMVRSGWIQVPSRPGAPASDCGLPAEVRPMAVPLADVAANVERAKAELAVIFVR